MTRLYSVFIAIGFAFVVQAAPLRYSSGGVHDDAGWAVTTNPGNGDIYVAGTVYAGAAQLNDMCLVKYNANGVFQWARRFGRPGQNDEALDVAISPMNGEIYVTGYVRDTVTGIAAVATLHFTPNGALVGQHAFAGLMQGDHIGQEIGFDMFGGVYVRGIANNAATGKDILLIKYNPGLSPLWVRLWDGANGDDISSAMKVSANGIYLVGKTEKPVGYDGVALRYSPAGVVTNVRRVSGAPGLDAELNDLAVFPNGDVLVTGMRQMAPPDMNVLVTFRWSGNFSITRWSFDFNNGPWPDGHARKVKLGPMGVVVAGDFLDAANGYQVITYALDPGNGAWIWTVVPVLASNELTKDLAISPSGAIYVVAESESAGVEKYMTLRIDAGVVTWVSNYGNQGHDIPSELVLNMNTMPIVTGRSFDQASGYDILTLRIDPATGLVL